MRGVRRVLVADDDPTIQQVLMLALSSHGLEVVLAGDGPRALELIHETKPDLVLLDVMMPHLDGLAVLRAVKDDLEVRDIPVALLTAKATDEEVWTGWASGADYYITKPFDVDEVLNFVDYLQVASA